VKRGLYTVHQRLVVKAGGKLLEREAKKMQVSLREWLGL